MEILRNGKHGETECKQWVNVYTCTMYMYIYTCSMCTQVVYVYTSGCYTHFLAEEQTELQQRDMAIRGEVLGVEWNPLSRGHQECHLLWGGGSGAGGNK